MKKNTTILYALIVIAGGVLLTQSCSKDLPEFIGFDPYTYSSTDDNGGNWKPILLTSGADYALPAPSDVSSPEYLAELDDVEAQSANLTSEQQEAVDYWGNNTMLRWMEIEEQLVAKYNLAPSPDADGNYGVPSSTNPGAYPYFPFAHPPYACRAYAYMAGAQFDALISAWHYKYAYNRPAPYTQSSSVNRAYPDNNLPSYPSEDAALAQTAEEVLKFLFPLEAEYITEKADECRNSRIWSGMNVESDLVAGDSIGHYVATQFINRAKNDNMKFAQVDKPTYQGMESVADSMWSDQWPHWENLEVPQRPVGITPKFGGVTLWWTPSVETVRPGPPPAIGSDEYKTAEQELLDYTDRLDADKESLAYYWSDGFSTYTPAGHWDKIAEDYILQYSLNPLRTARVFAYLNTAMEDAGISCWDTKYYYFYPRPPQGNPDIKTLFGLPNFPSYTSGHSTFSGAAAVVMSDMFPANAAEFEQDALDASNSRCYARIHWRFDCETGLAVGKTIGAYATTVADADGAGPN